MPDDWSDALRTVHTSLTGLRAQVDRLERQGADVDALRASVQALVERIEGLTTEVRQMREERIADRARAEALAEYDEEVRRVVRETVPRLRGRVEALEAHRASGERPVIVHDEEPDTRPRIWESEDGRRVIWWACGAAVLCCLAIGGGLTFTELAAWWDRSPVEATD